ncbi:DUF397 domain-containing protein [Streptomyces sp. M10(2022)]
MPEEHHNMLGPPKARWCTSTYSGVKVNASRSPQPPHLVPVRDSKRPAGSVITFGHDAWHTFVSELV